jgi:hypothetical protein
VEAHDGRIWAAAAPEGGVAIRFTLPAAPQMGLPFAPVGTGEEREK